MHMCWGFICPIRIPVIKGWHEMSWVYSPSPQLLRSLLRKKTRPPGAFRRSEPGWISSSDVWRSRTAGNVCDLRGGPTLSLHWMDPGLAFLAGSRGWSRGANRSPLLYCFWHFMTFHDFTDLHSHSPFDALVIFYPGGLFHCEPWNSRDVDAWFSDRTMRQTCEGAQVVTAGFVGKSWCGKWRFEASLQLQAWQGTEHPPKTIT